MKLLWWALGGALGVGILLSVAVAGNPSALPSDTPKSLNGRGKVILWIGDSISVDSFKGKPVKSLGNRVKARLIDAGFVVVDNSLGGRSANTFIAGTRKLKEPQKGIEQLQDHVDHDQPDIAIVMLGTNDLAGLAIGNKIGPTEKNFQKIVDFLRKNGVRVIGIGSPHYEEKPLFHKHEDTLREALERVYGEGEYIDIGDITGKYRMHGTGTTAAEFSDRIYNRLSYVL